MAKKTTELTEAEWSIINAVWENQPCAAPTIVEILKNHKGWTYSTVKTLMDRMTAKGLLKTEKIRNLTLYSAAITKTKARKTEITKTLKRAFDGALTPMMQFLIDNHNLSASQLNQLENLIRQKRTNKK